MALDGNGLIADLRFNEQGRPGRIPSATVKEGDLEKSSTRCNSLNDEWVEQLGDSGLRVDPGYLTQRNAQEGCELSPISFQQSHKYKTEMCKNFQLYNYCKWGDSCCFAHGRAELRSKTVFNYFYKTKICKHYHRDGFCPYSSRCQYFHFKSYEVCQDLLDSLTNKLLIRCAEDRRATLASLLESGERSQGRLPVFRNLHASGGNKSLYERFLDGSY